MCTSVVACIFDPPGFLAPLSLKLKHCSWDALIRADFRSLWVHYFNFIEEMRDVYYVWCKIDDDAVRPSVRLWILCNTSPCGAWLLRPILGMKRETVLGV